MSLTVADAFKVAFKTYETSKKQKQETGNIKPVSGQAIGNEDEASLQTGHGRPTNPFHDHINSSANPDIQVTDAPVIQQKTVEQTTRRMEALVRNITS